MLHSTLWQPSARKAIDKLVVKGKVPVWLLTLPECMSKNLVGEPPAPTKRIATGCLTDQSSHQQVALGKCMTLYELPMQTSFHTESNKWPRVSPQYDSSNSDSKHTTKAHTKDIYRDIEIYTVCIHTFKDPQAEL